MHHLPLRLGQQESMSDDIRLEQVPQVLVEIRESIVHGRGDLVGYKLKLAIVMGCLIFPATLHQIDRGYVRPEAHRRQLDCDDVVLLPAKEDRKNQCDTGL